MEISTNLEALNLANHDFSFSLYRELAKIESGNIFFSPLSIHVVMFLASIGAVSKTFEEMTTTIHLSKTTQSLEKYKDLLENLTSDNSSLKLATGIFVDTSFNVKKSFAHTSRKYLKSLIRTLNFKNDPEKQRDFINNWVLYKTNFKIDNLFPQDSINQATVLVLANAVHFNSVWAYKFNVVKDDFFHLTPISKVIVKMMTLKYNLLYYHDNKLKFSALELPYENFNFKMVILLPDAKNDLKNLENKFSKIKLHEVLKNMTQHYVTVKLPRFRLEESIQLKTILSNLGCPLMFTPAAEFNNIATNGNLYVSTFVHKTYADVNENGTEAAAATGITMSRCSMPRIYEEVDFIANHPFIFFIMGPNNELIFSGRLLHI